MVGVAFLFLCLRGWVRFIRRTRINLSDVFVSFAWIGFVADSIGHTILLHLGLELTPSKQSTVDVNADPSKLVQVYKVGRPLKSATSWHSRFLIIPAVQGVWVLAPWIQPLLIFGLMVDYLWISDCVSCDIMAYKGIDSSILL